MRKWKRRKGRLGTGREQDEAIEWKAEQKGPKKKNVMRKIKSKLSTMEQLFCIGLGILCSQLSVILIDCVSVFRKRENRAKNKVSDILKMFLRLQDAYFKTESFESFENPK